MRGIVVGFGMVLLSLQPVVASAEEPPKTRDRVIGGVISGLLGEPQQTPDAAYAAKERERLVSLLQSGEYVTSRQGEPVDLVVFGIPLTHWDHVYTARPIRSSQNPLGQGP